MVAFFSGCRFLSGQNRDDEETYVVRRVADNGTHRVYRFNPRQLVLESDMWPTMTAFLRRPSEGEALPSLQPIWSDSIQLSRRSAWLTGHFAGVGFATTADDTVHAASAGDYPTEREQLHHTHLAIYWLLHHLAAANDAYLRDALEQTKTHEHLWVREVRSLIRGSRTESLEFGKNQRSKWKEASPQFFAPKPSTEGDENLTELTSPLLKALACAEIDEQVSAINAWWVERERAGFRSRLDSRFRGALLVSFRNSPATENEITAAEKNLGQSLPPSYRSFLQTHGGLDIHPTGFRTTPIAELAMYTGEIREHLRNLRSSHPPTEQRELAIAAWQRESDAAIYLGGYRDHRNEAPLLLWWHDDSFLSNADVEHLQAVVEEARSLSTEASAFEGERIVPADTATVAMVAAVLSSDEPQRTRLERLEQQVAHLIDATNAERWTVAHAVRKGIKSKKLKERRDALTGRIRPDGKDGAAPLVRLERPYKAVSKPSGFPLFETSVTAALEALVDTIIEALQR